jgi:formylglycine-generating enzyme required for sulfatase activity
VSKLDSNGNVLWTRLFGGSLDEESYGIGLDAAGKLWIGGFSNSTFGGHTNAGDSDAFVAQYDSAGNLLGTTWFATSGSDTINGVAIGLDGAGYVIGSTSGMLGASPAGSADVFVAKLIGIPEPCTAFLGLGGAVFALARRRCRGGGVRTSTPAVEATNKLTCRRPALVRLSAMFIMVLGGGSTRAAIVTLETVTIGNPGNPNDQDYGSGAFGSVAATYAIGKYEVTLNQYAGFLNAIATTDTFGLYDPSQGSDLTIRGITRSGVSGSYTYSVVGDGNRPVTYVNWLDAARFTNWLHNGQPTGLQGLGTTERGAYMLDGFPNEINITRSAGARYWIPSESEWYKAAYYQPASLGGDADGYWLFPTRTNLIPGNTIGGTPNLANFYYNSVFSVTQSGNYDPTANYLSPAGAYSGSASYYGTFDQGGSVDEWTEGVTGSARTLRGGNFIDEYYSLQASISDFENPVGQTKYIGFRVATVPEPTAVVSLILAGGFLFASRSRPAN